MTSWVHGLNKKALLPSESERFARLALAIALHEADEAKIASQDPAWIDDLLAMFHAQNSQARSGSGIALPPGMRLSER